MRVIMLVVCMDIAHMKRAKAWAWLCEDQCLFPGWLPDRDLQNGGLFAIYLANGSPYTPHPLIRNPL